MGIENNTSWSFKDLEEMLRSAKTLKRNNEESSGILIGPSMAVVFFERMKFLRRGFFTHYPSSVGFGPKSCGTDGKPTTELCQANGKSETYEALSRSLGRSRKKRSL
jgi:hypothetical protein